MTDLHFHLLTPAQQDIVSQLAASSMAYEAENHRAMRVLVTRGWLHEIRALGNTRADPPGPPAWFISTAGREAYAAHVAKQEQRHD